MDGITAQIEWDGKTYHYSPFDIDIRQASVIKMHTGYGLMSWEKACQEMEPAALQALLWCVKQQNGEQCEIASLNFKLLSFFDTYSTAFAAAINAKAEADAAKPADPT